MKRFSKKIWITWEMQRRNKTLSKKLGAELYEIVVNKPKIKRYFISMVKTFKIIKKTKPEILFVQNPSLVLALYAILLRLIFGFKLIVDEHNAGIYPHEGNIPALNYIAKYIVRKSDKVIVTNTELSEVVERFGGRPLILPDPLPELSLKNIKTFEKRKNFHVVFVCTWAKDEPYIEVIEAARMLGEEFKITITGKHKGKINCSNIPSNVELTDFLPDDDYIKLLNESDAIMVLTSRENCLNCGAYEAVAVEKPLILSNKQVLKKYFNKGAVFTENEKNDICLNLKKIKENGENMKLEIQELKKILSCEWDRIRDDVELKLYQL